MRPRQDEMTHLWEANASRRNHTELSLLNIKMMMVMLIDDTILVVITFSKADAERLRLIKRELRLTSDYYKSD